MTHEPPRIIISEDDYGRLRFIATMSKMGRRLPPTGLALASELDRARVVPATELPNSVVAMGSTVVFRDDDTGRIDKITIVYPEEDAQDCRLLSALTPLGTALIGLSEGQSIRWRSAVGDLRNLTILHVSQMPAPSS